MSFLTDTELVECPRCGRPDACRGWVREYGQCGACGARDEAERIRALDVSPEAVAARLRERDRWRAPWASESERDRETRALLALLGVEVRP